MRWAKCTSCGALSESILEGDLVQPLVDAATDHVHTEHPGLRPGDTIRMSDFDMTASGVLPADSERVWLAGFNELYPSSITIPKQPTP